MMPSRDPPVAAHGSRIDEENPWPGLNAFNEEAHRFFNGRRTEAAELRRMVQYAPVTVVFGRSGLGKTSQPCTIPIAPGAPQEPPRPPGG